MAQREIGLAVGEPPPRAATRRRCSRAARCSSAPAPATSGSITAFYTVLVEGDDMNEPVADAVRSILDGHIVLSRDLAASGHFPAIDVESSSSAGP